MSLRTQMVDQGRWLFRWRSYLPLLLIPLVVLAIREARSSNFHHPLAEYGWEIFCMAVSASGLLVRIIAVGFAAPDTSGRNTRCQRAASLNTTGLYSIVRHPLYVGNFFILEGFVLYFGVWWCAALGALVFWLYYERIMLAEEAFLEQQFGDVFLAWAKNTPAFVPRPALWRWPQRRFSVGRAIRNEYTTAMLLVLLFVSMKAVKWLWVDPNTPHDWQGLSVSLAAALLVYLSVRFVKKKTRLLQGA